MESPSNQSSVFVQIIQDGFYFTSGPSKPDHLLNNLETIEKVLSNNLPYSQSKKLESDGKFEEKNVKILRYSNNELVSQLVLLANENYQSYLNILKSKSPFIRLFSLLEKEKVDLLYKKIEEIANKRLEVNSINLETLTPKELEKLNSLKISSVDEEHLQELFKVFTGLGWKGTIWETKDFFVDLSKTLKDLVEIDVLDKQTTYKLLEKLSTPHFKDYEIRRIFLTLVERHNLSHQVLINFERFYSLCDSYAEKDKSNQLVQIGLIFARRDKQGYMRSFNLPTYQFYLFDSAIKYNATLCIKELELYYGKDIANHIVNSYKEDALSLLVNWTNSTKENKVGFKRLVEAIANRKIPENSASNDALNHLINSFAELQIRQERLNDGLYMSLECAHPTLFNFFLGKGADPNVVLSTMVDDPIYVSTKNRASTYGKEPILVRVARTGHLSYLQNLIKYGADLNAVDYAGRTALIKAVQESHMDCALVLLRSGALIKDEKAPDWLLDRSKITNGDKTTLNCLLVLAVVSGSAQLVKILIERGGDVSVKVSNKPLLELAKGNPAVIAELSKQKLL